MRSPAAWAPSAPEQRKASEVHVVAHLQAICWPHETATRAAATRDRATGALEHLVRRGLPFAVLDGARTFDLHEVHNFLFWTSERFGDALWHEGCVAAERRYTQDLPDDCEHVLTLRYGHELNLAAHADGARFRTQLLSPVAGPHQRDVVVMPVVAPGLAFEQGRCIDVRGRASPDAPAARIEANVTLRATWQGTHVEPGRVEPFRDAAVDDVPFLAVSEGPIQVTDPIRSLAKEIAGDAKTPWDVLRGFWDFFFSRLTVGLLNHHVFAGPDPLAEIVRHGRTDCYYGSALLCAVCRACGIPARLVHGRFLQSPGTGATHYWAEALVHPYGWLPFDPASSWVKAGGDRDDKSYSELFLGRLEPRLVLERLPRKGIVLDPRPPREGYIRMETVGNAIVLEHRELGTGALAFTQLLDVLSHERRSTPVELPT